MKNISVIIILFISFLGPLAQAETRVSGKVLQVRVDSSGLGYIRFDVPRGHAPATCGDSHNYHLAFNTNTNGGKGVLSLALAARSTGQTLVAIGSGECSGYNVVENWSWGYIQD